MLYHTPAAGRARVRKKPEQVICLTPGVRFEPREGSRWSCFWNSGPPGRLLGGVEVLVLASSQPASQHTRTTPAHRYTLCSEGVAASTDLANIQRQSMSAKSLLVLPVLAIVMHNLAAGPLDRFPLQIGLRSQKFCFPFTAVCVRVTLLGFEQLGSCNRALPCSVPLANHSAPISGNHMRKMPRASAARSRWCQVT